MPTNLNAVLRHWIIDSCLTNKGRTFPPREVIHKKVAEQVEGISWESIKKDMSDMKRIYNAPIDYDRTKGGYYYKDPGFSIKSFPLTEVDVEAMNFSSIMMRRIQGSSFYKDYEAAVDRVLQDRRLTNILDKPLYYIFQPEEPPSTEGHKWIQQLLNAVLMKQVVSIRYQSFQREPRDHTMSPYMLKEYQHRWYLFGYNHEKGKILTLALDRISSITETADKYIRTDDFEEVNYFKYCIGIMKGEKPERVILLFDEFQKTYVLSNPLHHSQKTKEVGAGLEVELNVYISHELVRMILSFGAGVKILEPYYFGSQLKNIAEQLSSIYS